MEHFKCVGIPRGRCPHVGDVPRREHLARLLLASPIRPPSRSLIPYPPLNVRSAPAVFDRNSRPSPADVVMCFLASRACLWSEPGSSEPILRITAWAWAYIW